MAKSFNKAALWSLGGVLALPVVAYATLYVVNLRDRPPAPETAVLRSLLEGGSAVRSRGNSYLFLLGFAGPPDENPTSLGIERSEWMERARPAFDRADDPLESDYDIRALRSAAVAELADACQASETACVRLLESDGATAQQWLADERWLLDRYRALLAMVEFREATPFELLAPLPSYNVVFEGQRLHIVDAWRSATDNDAAAVSAALERDLVFWRMVLRNSDVLITKMIATAAIIRHFKFGNLVLRRLPQDVAARGIPASWRVAMTDEERSMLRTLAGEWAFFDGSIKKIGGDPEKPFESLSGPTDPTAWDRLTWVLLKPFWQPQDLSNQHATLMLELGKAVDVPYEEIPRAVPVADALQDSALRPVKGLYNFTGNLVMGMNHWSVSSYAARVSDLEGIRRVALAVAELRAAGTTEADIGERIATSEIVDPYTKAPFTWLPNEGVLVFHGLEPHKPRSEHKLAF